jgi:hypothetical protein
LILKNTHNYIQLLLSPHRRPEIISFELQHSSYLLEGAYALISWKVRDMTYFTISGVPGRFYQEKGSLCITLKTNNSITLKGYGVRRSQRVEKTLNFQAQPFGKEDFDVSLNDTHEALKNLQTSIRDSNLKVKQQAPQLMTEKGIQLKMPTIDANAENILSHQALLKQLEAQKEAYFLNENFKERLLAEAFVDGKLNRIKAAAMLENLTANNKPNGNQNL